MVSISSNFPVPIRQCSTLKYISPIECKLVFVIASILCPTVPSIEFSTGKIE